MGLLDADLQQAAKKLSLESDLHLARTDLFYFGIQTGL
jgi:hypothetical protein